MPSEIHDVFRNALVTKLTRDELLRALTCVIDGLLFETDGAQELAIKVKSQLIELTAQWDT